MTHPVPVGPELYPGMPDYWAAVTDVPCPACRQGTVRWHEAGYVPGWRRCDSCHQEFQAAGTAHAPALKEVS